MRLTEQQRALRQARWEARHKAFLAELDRRDQEKWEAVHLQIARACIPAGP
jgi:hypothetical protein